MNAASATYGGTPDYYYDQKHDLWVEYKRLVGWKLPHAVTELQLQWLRRRHAAGGNACVIVGWEENPRNRHGLILENPDDWSLTKFDREFVLARSVPAAGVAAYINQRTLNAAYRQSSGIHPA